MPDNVTPAVATDPATAQTSSNTETPNATPAPASAQPPDPKLGAAYAKLAREQKAARQAQEALKAERLKLEADRQSLESIKAESEALKEAKANAKRFPLKFLESMGLTYQDLVDAQLNEGQPTPTLEAKAVKDELEQFKRQLSEKEEKAGLQRQEALRAEQERLVQDFRAQVTQHVTSNPDKYELTNAFGQADLVFKVIDQYVTAQQAQGVPNDQIKILSFDEAAELVEKDLEEQAEKLRSTKKFTAKTVDVPPNPRQPAQKLEQPIRSLTNSLSGSTTAAQPKKALSQAEREQRALAILKQQG